MPDHLQELEKEADDSFVANMKFQDKVCFIRSFSAVDVFPYTTVFLPMIVSLTIQCLDG